VSHKTSGVRSAVVRVSRRLRPDLVLAAVSGVLLVLSVPRVGHPACAWVALTPLWLAVGGWPGLPGGHGPSLARAFGLGLLTGGVAFTGTLYWTATAGATFGGLPVPAAVGAMLLLVAWLALFPALAALCVAACRRAFGVEALLLAPFAWVASEYLRGAIVGGFPWALVGATQVTVLPVAQLASVTGVYGVSLLVAAAGAAIAYASLAPVRTGRAALGVVSVTVAGVVAWGSWRLADSVLVHEGTPLRIGLVQPDIAQDEKGNPDEAPRIRSTLDSLTRDVVRRGAEFVLWPESATPFRLSSGHPGEAAVRALARETGVPLLVGGDEDDPGRSGRLYNAAWLIGPDGHTLAVHRKVRLVPFGEFVPFRRLLFFVRPIVEAGGYTPGDGVVLLPVGGRMASTAICYEAIHPSLARDAVMAGSTLLTTITNDAWYGRSSAAAQHFALASMRAIEQGRYLARAANTGISGIVDPYGRIVQVSGIFEQVGLVGEVRLLTRRTPYAVLGDVVAHASVVLTGLVLVAGRRVRGRAGGMTP
jgi:apolipoprotein N-acyltransferase